MTHDTNPHDPTHTHGLGWRFPVDRRAILNDEGRLAMLQPALLLESLQVVAGETAIDIGAGTGFWTLPLANLVGPQGKVIAVDVEQVMLDDIRALAEANTIGQIELVLSEEVSIPLPNSIADVAVMGFVLHEPPDPPAFLREVKRLLKPDGKLLVIEWHKRETEMGPPPAHRIAESDARTMMKAEGFIVEPLSVPTADAYAFLASRV